MYVIKIRLLFGALCGKSEHNTEAGKELLHLRHLSLTHTSPFVFPLTSMTPTPFPISFILSLVAFSLHSPPLWSLLLVYLPPFMTLYIRVFCSFTIYSLLVLSLLLDSPVWRAPYILSHSPFISIKEMLTVQSFPACVWGEHGKSIVTTIMYRVFPSQDIFLTEKTAVTAKSPQNSTLCL